MAEMCLCVCVGLRAVTTFHVARSGGEEVEPVWELFGQKKSGSTSLMEAGGMGETFSALAYL